MKPFLPALGWLVLITYLSAAPGLPSFDWNLISFDKAAHAFCYGLLTWLICRGFFQKTGCISRRNALFAVAFSALWGLAMEWMQGTFFPHRFFEWPDELANLVGAILSGGLFYFQKNSLKQ